MNAKELQQRTKIFGLKIIELIEDLPRGIACNVFGAQLLRSATSVGANYHAACRAKSRADFIAKMKVVEEEADESCYWLEMLIEGKLVKSSDAAALLREADELTAICSSSVKTAKAVQLISNRQSSIVNRQ